MKINANQLNLSNKVKINSVYQKSTAVPFKPTVTRTDAFKKEEKSETELMYEAYKRQKMLEYELAVKKQQLQSDFKAAQAEIEAIKETFDVLIKCIKIAGRIIEGDNVPPRDHKLLMEHYPDMYSTAITVRRAKDDPENHDTLVEEEEKVEETGEMEAVEPPEFSESVSTESTQVVER